MKRLHTPGKLGMSTPLIVCSLLICILLMSGCSKKLPETNTAQNNVETNQDLNNTEQENKKTLTSKNQSAKNQNVIEEKKQSSDLRIIGYLPAGLLVSSGQEFDSNIKVLTDAILNTAVYWDETGTLQTTEEFAPAMEKWNSLSLQNQLRWCTINPLGKLIRNSTAGQTIDTIEKRKTLSETILAFCKKHNFDGVDIDWEFPLESEWEDFSSFVLTLQQVLASDNKQLSLALYPNNIFLSSAAITALDRVNIMAYDQFDEDGHHSTYETAELSIEYFTNYGFQPDQLCLGIPFYGRPTDASNKWPFYSEVAGELQDNENVKDDIFYNGRELVKKKTSLAKEKLLNGVMLYHIYCDLPAQEKNSLTSIIYQESQS